MRRRPLVTSLAVTVLAALGAPLATANAAGAAVTRADCRAVSATTPAPAPEAVVLTIADDGRAICVRPGQRVDVALSVDPDRYPTPATWWGSITSDGPALVALPDPATPVRGTTVARFRAARSGTATLNSSQSPCGAAPAARQAGASASPHRCLVIRLWSVTVTVA